MTTHRPLILLAFLLLLVQTPSAQRNFWEQVREKMTADSGYSLQCDYIGPEGLYHFSYNVHGDGDKILTEILRGSTRGAGTRIYYDPAKDAENVAMQTRFMRLRRSLQARDIKDSPLHRPLFRHLLGELRQAEPTDMVELDSQRMLLTFGDTASEHDCLEVDPQGNPVELRRMEAGKEVNCLTFRELQWGEKPMDWDD